METLEEIKEESNWATSQTIFHHNKANKSRGQLRETAHYLSAAVLLELQSTVQEVGE